MLHGEERMDLAWVEPQAGQGVTPAILQETVAALCPIKDDWRMQPIAHVTQITQHRCQ